MKKTGLKVWEINLENGEIVQAKFKADGMNVKTREMKMVLDEKPGHIYIPAESRKAAKKKFDGILTSVKNKK